MNTINGSDYMPPVQGGPPTDAPSQDLGEEEFLKLLMTQISNQDPLNPMETEQFMNQITSMNSLQQQISANERLDDLVMAMGALNNETAVNLVGKTVVVEGNSFPHEAGEAETLSFFLAEEAATATVTVTDGNGKVVAVLEPTDLPAGEQSLTWDGLDETTGNPVPDGDYSFRIAAKDADDGHIDVTTFVQGVVDELRFDSGSPEVVVGGQLFQLAAITRVIGAEEPSVSSGQSSGAPSVEPAVDTPSTDLAAFKASLHDLLISL